VRLFRTGGAEGGRDMLGASAHPTIRLVPIKTAKIGLVSLPLAWLIVLAGCKRQPADPDEPGDFAPTEPQLLSTGSPTKDEDPSVIRTSDGRMLVAWFSDRGGNSDIYVTSTSNGRSWIAATRVTTSQQGDFYPTLLQDEQGTFHMTWFRWSAPFVGNIWYNSSADGLTWSQSTEAQVTRAFDVDDWVPTFTRAADGTLLVYLVSEKRDAPNPTSEIYLARKRPGQASWDAVASIAGLNSPTEHDHLPVVARTGTGLTLVWVRHDQSEPLPWLNRKSDLFYATSADGVTWSAPARITNDAGNVVNLFPALFPASDGQWSLAWLSTRAGSPQVFALPIAGVGQYPSGVTAMTAMPPGYSHRLAATPVAGVYLGVWVQGPEGSQDIYYRFFRR